MLAVYIHWPFCVSKCPYCDFNSHVGDTSGQERWALAYRRELESYAARLPGRSVGSIFFGGGSPSLMDARTVDSVLQDIARLWPIDPDAEITLEANPSSAEAAKFEDFRKSGVNRLSLGIQSLNDETLRFFGRAHNAEEAKKALALAARVFPRFSFDLIYSYAGQTPVLWKRELKEALAYAQNHLSLYQLTIEPHTQFYVRAAKGEKLALADEDSAAMYETTQELMNAAGLPAYEISNHAKRGFESRHNLAYWHYDDYIGIGPGAHGRFCVENARHATENIRAPELWIQQVEAKGNGIKLEETLDQDTSMREALLMGLRLAEGIDIENWNKKFEKPLLSFIPAERFSRLQKEGLIANDKDALRATSAGLQRLNALLTYLI